MKSNHQPLVGKIGSEKMDLRKAQGVTTIPATMPLFDFSQGINPIVTNGISHPYHLDESTFIHRGIRSDFSFLFHFSMKIKIANRIAPDGTPRFAASHLGLFCLPMTHKKDARLIWVKQF